MKPKRKRPDGPCQCRVCVYGRKVEAHIAGLPTEQATFFNDMYERLAMAEDDIGYWKANAQGIWPKHET